MTKSYCTQNNGDCSTCSLVNYNRDCYNNPVHGGYRPGAGRKPTGLNRKRFVVYVTDDEKAKIKELLEYMRSAE